MAERFATVDDYVQSQPEAVRPILEELRRRIHGVVPSSGETIRYQMPTITMHGTSLVHLAAWKKHIALYPLPDVEPDLDLEVAPYRGTKDTLRLALDRPIPYALVERLVALLVQRRAADEP